MNRRERQIRSTEEILDVMDQCVVCRLAFHDDEDIYVVPLNYCYENIDETDSIRLWFHGALNGKKLTLLQKNPRVGFEMDCNVQLIESVSPCSYSYSYSSLIGKGTATIVDDADTDTKKKALSLMLQHHAGLDNINIPEERLKFVKVFFVDVQEISGKRRM